MKQLPDKSFRFSPRDLLAYLEGDFSAWCDRRYAEGHQNGHAKPDAVDEEMELVIRRGFEHEEAYVATLRSCVADLAEIAKSQSGDDSAFDATRTAMQNGARVITQGELRAAAWMGIADILRRRDGSSTFGDYYYEPWDTKLARTAKPYFLVQLCAYAEMLEHMQGHRPHQFGFILGDSSEKTFRTDDVWHYVQRLKRSFESFHAEWSPDAQPDAGLDRSHGRWSTHAERLLQERDDLSLVAGMTRSQTIRLRAGGIETVAALGAHEGAPVKKMSETTFRNLKAQAEMQVRSRTAGTIEWKFRETDADRPHRGLALLPPASPNDIFFDIEGFPFANNGLEYLLGVVTVDRGEKCFQDWWAHDQQQEKIAFEQFIDWAYARWKSDSTLHIHHYAAYERSALCRLMSKHGTRENQVDELLRNNVLVDLYPVVLQGMVIGTPSYSLKHIEHLYMPPRGSTGVTTAGGSVVEYQRWIDAGESQSHAQSAILTRIRDYNRIDCESTVELRDWLLARQLEAGIVFLPHEPPKPDASEASEAEVLASALLTRAETISDSEEKRVTQLVAWLLEFHRREEKPWWWHHFERMNGTEQELFDDQDCLAGLERTSTPPSVIKRSSGLEYRFDPDQESKMSAGEGCVLAGTEGLKCEIHRFVDRDAGLVELKVGPGKQLPSRLSLIPARPISNVPLRDSILRFAGAWSADADCSPAISDLLHRNRPRLTGVISALRIDETSALAPQATDAVRRLDRSTLCIQGPPGTGKTTIAAEIILQLIADGARVGIVANNHDVVLNLMDCIACCGDEAGQHPRLVKVGGDDSHRLIVSGRIEHIDSKEAAAEIATGPLVVGGTAWLFARAELEQTLDYLFIEEAGQFSLANAVAVGASSRNLVLLGDQMQLSQPTQGSHPGESGLSALDYLLHGHATVPPELGIFLGTSYRMHPDICGLISEAYYEGRLHSAAATATHRIIGGNETSIHLESGVRFVAIDHAGCTQDSEEEACEIEIIVRELLGCRVTVKEKPERAMTIEDILVVAPFNMQVRALKKRLGAKARVGTVDRFQGQEAPVVIVSMCASTIEDAPRGPKFLLEKNRLNVAISRAQALAIVVGSSQLGAARVRSIEEMQLVSGWCRIEAYQA